MGMYDVFETDQKLEANGIWLDYGDFRILIAAAGQGNKKYVQYAEKKLKPVRRAIESGALSNERSQAIMADIYAKTVVLSWETQEGAKMKSGIETPDGKIQPFSTELVMSTFKSLPRLFMDVQEQAASLSNFRKEDIEEDTKNS